MDYLKRTKKVQDWLIEHVDEVDCILISAPESRRYFTGFTGTFGYCLISKQQIWFLTDFRYRSQAEEQVPYAKHILLNQFSPETSIRMICETENLEVIGFEGGRMVFSAYDRLVKNFGRANLIDIGNILDRFRVIKEEAEIDLLAKAEAIGDAAFEHICKFIKPGIRESEVALELEFKMRQLGASGTSFTSIVGSGYRSALPHGVASQKIIRSGELVVLDFGCIYEGYCSDMTRTVAIGDPGKEMRQLYQLVKDTQQHCLDAIHAGVVGKDIHQIAVDSFAEAGMSDYFGHGLGHSVGLEIHEEPRFSPAEKGTIEAGTCITVEPGLYLPGKGGVRIEDMIVVTEENYRNLTHSPKELIIL